MKCFHVLERSPRDWKSTMRQSVVLTVFHTQNICHSVWKNLRTTLWCFVFLQSRGEGLKSKENYGTKFYLLFKPSPRDWRKRKHQSVVLRNFHTLWHIFWVWKTVRTTFWRIVVSQSRGDRSKTWENFMASGSQSETYLIWRYAELNRLLVGSGQIPLNIELQQDDRNVCCSHTVVLKEFPRAKPKRTPEGKGVYLTVYPKLSPNTDSISF